MKFKQPKVSSLHKLGENVYNLVSPTVVYIIKSELDIITDLISQIHQLLSISKSIAVIFIPKLLITCELLLEKSGVWGLFSSYSWPLSFTLLDNDLLSLHSSSSFRDLFLESDPSILYDFSTGIFKLLSLATRLSSSSVTSSISSSTNFSDFWIRGKGRFSKKLAKSVITEIQRNSIAYNGHNWQGMIILDRTCDLLTPFLTPHTYEALLHEFLFPSNMFFISVPRSIVPSLIKNKSELNSLEKSNSFSDKNDNFNLNNKFNLKNNTKSNNNFNNNNNNETSTKDNNLKISLNSTIHIWKEIRNLNIFSQVPGKIMKLSARLQSFENEKHKDPVRFVREILPFLPKEKQNLATHIDLLTFLKDKTNEKKFEERIKMEQIFINNYQDSSLSNNSEQNLNSSFEKKVENKNFEVLKSFVGESLAKNEKIETILRALIIYTHCTGSIGDRYWDWIKNEIFSHYGHQHSITIFNCLKLNLIRQNKEHQNNSNDQNNSQNNNNNSELNNVKREKNSKAKKKNMMLTKQKQNENNNNNRKT